MRIFYISLKDVIKKAAQVLIVILAILLMLKIIQYNLLKSVMSNFEPIYQGKAKDCIVLTISKWW